MIYTFGYMIGTLRQTERFMAAKKVDLLVDLRSAPYSRRPDKYEFNRNSLRIVLRDRYLWKGDALGGKPGPATPEGIAWLLDQEKAKRALLLMCVERDPLQCHRFQDIGRRLLAQGLDIMHLTQPTDLPFVIPKATSRLLKEGGLPA